MYIELKIIQKKSLRLDHKEAFLFNLQGGDVSKECVFLPIAGVRDETHSILTTVILLNLGF